jgi:pyridoxine/pyridoxamine 5'-phosphate oxidase
MQAKTFSDLSQPLVFRPQKHRWMDEARGDQVRVDEADAVVVKTASLDGQPYFFHPSNCRLRQKIQ